MLNSKAENFILKKMAGLKIFAVFLVLAFVFELAFTTHDGVMFDEECAQEVGIDKGIKFIYLYIFLFFFREVS